MLAHSKTSVEMEEVEVEMVALEEAVAMEMTMGMENSVILMARTHRRKSFHTR